jgi:tetratricopeptide (TPR) repeat protein
MPPIVVRDLLEVVKVAKIIRIILTGISLSIYIFIISCASISVSISAKDNPEIYDLIHSNKDFKKAIIYIIRDKPSEALPLLHRSLNEASETDKSVILPYIGYCYLELHNINSADKYISIAIENNCKSDLCFQVLFCILLANHKYNEIINLSDKLEIESNVFTGQYQYVALAYKDLGDNDKYEIYLKKDKEHNPRGTMFTFF